MSFRLLAFACDRLLSLQPRASDPELRIWDCDPYEMAREDILAEIENVRAVWFRVLARQDGNHHDEHPEVLRFVNKPSLLVARHDFLQMEYDTWHVAAQGSPPEAREEPTGFSEHRVWPMQNLQDLDWYAWVVESGWQPAIPDRPAAPWQELGISYERYRRERDIGPDDPLPALARDDLDIKPGDFAYGGPDDTYRYQEEPDDDDEESDNT